VAIPDRLRWYFVPIALIPLAVIRASLLAESDTFWQIRVGQDILRTHQIPQTDPYSWTAFGTEWHPNSWAFDVLLALAYKLGDLPLVALTSALFIPLIALTVALSARRLGARPGVTLLVILLGFTPLVAWLAARPQIVDYVAIPLLLVLIDIAVRSETKVRRLSALAAVGLVQVVWVNLHLVAPLGVAVVATCAAGHLIQRFTRRTAFIGAAAILLATAGSLASPFGWHVLDIALSVRTNSEYVLEWAHFSPRWISADVLLLTAVGAAIAAWRLRAYPHLITVTFLAASGLYAIRMLPIAVIAGLPVLCRFADSSARRAAYLDSRRVLVRLAWGGLILVESVVGLAKIPTLGEPPYPIGAVRAMPAACRLFNGYRLGGPVILLRPDVLVSQDSRSDLYGGDLLLAAHRIEFDDDGLRKLELTGATCALILPKTPLAQTLRTAPGWRVAGGDATGVLFVRTPPDAR
jgi:hypothetical protein